jgi:hypothetical protein
MLQVVLTSPTTGKPMVDAHGQHSCITVSVGLSGLAEGVCLSACQCSECCCIHPRLFVPLIVGEPFLLCRVRRVST